MTVVASPAGRASVVFDRYDPGGGLSVVAGSLATGAWAAPTLIAQSPFVINGAPMVAMSPKGDLAIPYGANGIHVLRIAADGTVGPDTIATCAGGELEGAWLDSSSNAYVAYLPSTYTTSDYRYWLTHDAPAPTPSPASCPTPFRMLVITPSPAQPGQPVHFDGSSFVSGDPTGWDFKWDFEGTGSWVDSGSNSQVDHVYARAGTYLMHYQIWYPNGGGEGDQRLVAVGESWPGTPVPALPAPPIPQQQPLAAASVLRSVSVPSSLSRKALLDHGIRIRLVAARTTSASASLVRDASGHVTTLTRSRRSLKLGAGRRATLLLRLRRGAWRSLRRMTRVYVIVSAEVPGSPGRAVLVRRAIRLTG